MAVTVDTIATALGRPPQDDPEAAQWSMWIDDALLLIGARLGDVTELDQARLDYVVREAVTAHVRNPEDATQVSWNVGQVSGQKSYRTATGRVHISNDWWALLTPDDVEAGAFVIDTVGFGNIHQPWCDLNMGGAGCSCGAVLAGYPIYEL